MRIGVDLDNTIVCYDGVFHRIAVRLGWLPDECATDKQAVRDYLRAAGRQDDWTRLQGIVYGEAMTEARPFPSAIKFFDVALRNGWSVYVVSHRTRRPYLGPESDLHQAAREWLQREGITDASRVGLPESHVFFEESLENKLARIGELSCEVFIDDLPELLLHEDFPAEVRRICFDPCHRCDDERLDSVGTWKELIERCFEGDSAL
jgi:hypothetical protein